MELNKEELDFLNQLFEVAWKAGAFKDEKIGMYASSLRAKLNK